MDFKSIALYTLSRIYGFISILMRPFIRIDKNSILFWSWKSRQYSCNPKAISDFLTLYHKDEFKLYWSFKDKAMFGSKNANIIPVKWGSWAYLKAALKSKFLISNTRNDIESMLFYKRKDQIYIMTWHAGMSLKRVEKDSNTSLPNAYKRRSQEDSLMCDLMLSGSEFQTNLFKNSFWYDKEVLNHGTPRNDIFFKDNSNLRKDICQSLHIKDDSIIVLYAPTFRSRFDPDVVSFNWNPIKNAIEKKYGKRAILLVRLHPNINHLTHLLRFKYNDEDCINISDYPDMQELLVISDILITDYSSSMFDFSLTKRPCFLLVKDRKEYDRGFYLSLNELPFNVAEDEQSLVDSIESFDERDYINKLDKFNNTKINTFETGNACEALVYWMQNKI